jgi:hypothetical protein
MIRVDQNRAFWERVGIPAHLDLVEVLPASLPKSRRFETKADVVKRSIEREQRLRKTRNDHVAEFLADCRSGNYACRQPICPICGRLFRRWLAANILALYKNLRNPVTITLFCETVPEGQLHTVEIEKIHDRVRQRFRRAGLDNIVAVGGTEAAYRAEHKDWLIHLHLLIGDVEKSELKRLRGAWAKTGIPAAMRVSPLVDAPLQIGYLQKFSTFHRPGEQSSHWRARAYPLPQPQFEELAGWFDNREFGEFLFMLGTRRRGHRIRRLGPGGHQRLPKGASRHG